MRRSGYRSDDSAELREIMERCQVGHLGIVTPDGYPRPVPVCFAWHEGMVVFHGATSGEKHRAVTSGAPVAFSASLPYSVLPPALLGDASACSTTQFYKSAFVRGRGLVFTDARPAARALEALMHKYAPEGGYALPPPDSPEEQGVLGRTAVFAIEPIDIEVRVYMGQEMAPERRASVIAALRWRGSDLDLATAGEIERHAPP